MAYIIGEYNRWDSWDREHAKYKFTVNGQEYAVKEIQLEWGLPQLGLRVDEEQQPESYFIYDSLEEAMKFVRQIKSLN